MLKAKEERKADQAAPCEVIQGLTWILWAQVSVGTPTSGLPSSWDPITEASYPLSGPGSMVKLGFKPLSICLQIQVPSIPLVSG